MTRAVWFLAGAGAGLYAVVRVRRAAEAFTPDGLADRLAGLSVGLRLLRDEVLAGAAEKENDLRERLGVTLHETPQLPPAPSGGPATRTTSMASTTREGDH
jgi:uncharacterized protein DUF6167